MHTQRAPRAGIWCAMAAAAPQEGDGNTRRRQHCEVDAALECGQENMMVESCTWLSSFPRSPQDIASTAVALLTGAGGTARQMVRQRGRVTFLGRALFCSLSNALACLAPRSRQLWEHLAEWLRGQWRGKALDGPMRAFPPSSPLTTLNPLKPMHVGWPQRCTAVAAALAHTTLHACAPFVAYLAHPSALPPTPQGTEGL